MQANQSIGIAVIPFRKDGVFASVCSDGDHHAVMSDGLHKEFTSLWWAVEFLFDKGFSYDWDLVKAYAHSSFVTLCVPRGFSVRRCGSTWYAFKDGSLVHSGASKWACEFMCVRDCYTKKF